ncbi:MAG TPA: tyrosine recombinase XerC [Casimicrobiaceae bacterium]|nr:tyrosine recombinase XerC [Casimicrobiaceae bacterium]
MPAPRRASPPVPIRSADPLVVSFEQHLATRPARTRSAYRRDLARLQDLAGDAPLATLSPAQLRRFLATLHGRGLSARSLARVLSGWRAFYRFAIDRERTLKDNPCAGLKAPKAARRLPAVLSPDEAVRLVAIDDEGVLAARDRALLELAYSSGLRVSELAGLDLEGLDLASAEVRVLGKGAKERIVPVGEAACVALKAWLVLRAGVPVIDAQAVFVSRSGRRLGARAIQQRLAAWAVRRGLARHVHPHMLRHSFASHLLQSSGDLRAVQELLGHASIASTQIYTHLDFQHLAKIYDQAHPRAKKLRRRR